MRFTTSSRSVYEVDQQRKLIRRLKGEKDPTPRQGKDGEWREYMEPLIVEVGRNVMIQWTDEHPVTEETRMLYELADAPPPEPYKGSLTITSPVEEIDNMQYN